MFLKQDIKDIYKLSPMQEGMYFHALMDKQADKYFEQLSYRIFGTLHIAVIGKSLDILLQRHDILRTVFNSKKAGLPLQVVLKERKMDFRFEDLRHMPRDAQEKYIAQLKERDRRTPFDLDKDCLMRVQVLQLDSEEFEYIWSHHHILMDGWSVGILISEYSEIYDSLISGRPHQLQPVIQYRAYINWLESRDKQTAADYWAHYLQGHTRLTGMPARNINDAGNYLRRRVTLRMSTENTLRLHQLAADHQVTLNTVVQCVWAVLLSRYNDTDDVVFGSVISGRPSELPGVLAMIGLFINTIPVRISVSDSMSFVTLLQQVQQQAMEAEPHHYYPLADVQAASTAKQQLLDHILVFENYPVTERLEAIGKENETAGNDGDSSTKILQVDIFEQTNYDFNVVVGARTQLVINFDYNGNVYDDWQVNALSAQMEYILEQVLEDAHLLLQDLQLLSPAEKATIIAAGEGTSFTSFTGEETLVQRFEAQVRLTPDAIAVEDAQQHLTYAELNTLANQLAHYLRGQYHIQPEQKIALLTERSVATLVGIFGILKSGAAYVPVDPDYPAERIAYTLEDAAVTAVVTDISAALPDDRIGIAVTADQQLQLKDKGEMITLTDGSNPLPVLNAGSLAYIIYTSGSTGRPKGVMVGHRQVMNLLFAEGFRFDFGPADIWTLFHSVCFDFSVWEIFGSLLYGGRLIIVEKALARNAASFAELICRKGVTVLNQVPGMFTHVMDALLQLQEPHQLRYIIFGGEALYPASLAPWYERYPQVQLINMYGITETTVHVTYKAIGETEIAHGLSNIGVPLPNVRLYIMDARHQLLPFGMEGEIVVGGGGVSAGYLNRATLTAERFIADPYHTGERLYCSGDTGVMLPGGEVIYHGRKDDQVKIRGYRIELGEITQQLLQYEGIDHAIVKGRTDRNGEQQLVAYFVSREPQTITALRAHLQARLPDYMLPAYYVPVPLLPVTANGKVDVKQLPSPEDNSIATGTAYVAPSTPMEIFLAGIWQEVLGKQRIGVHDNFFEIGGHSLKAIRIFSRVSREAEVQIEMREIFLHPTIAALAAVMTPGMQQDAKEIPVAASQLHYVLSHAQRRLWILDQMETGQNAYNIPVCYRFRGSFDRHAFATALDLLVARHEVLRTRFIVVDGEPRQQIIPADAWPFELEFTDLTHLPDAEIHAQELVRTTASRPFNLSEGPLLNAVLIAIAPDDHIFVLNMHHIISDAWSVNVLVQEVTACYEACKQQQDYQLPPLRIQYKDYAQWQHLELSAGRTQQHRAYWLDRFRDEAPVLEMPAGKARPAIKTYCGNGVTFLLDQTLTATLHKLGQAEGASLFMTLLSTVYTLLYRYTGQEDIVIGSPVAGREHPDLEGQIGFYVNTLALRQQFQGHHHFNALLRQVKENLVAAFAHQSYPFDSLVDEFDVARDMSRSPLFDVMVSLQHAGDMSTEKDMDGLEVGSFDSQIKVSKYDLNFIFKEAGDVIIVYLEYNTDIYDRSDIERMQQHYRQLLQSLTAQPAQSLRLLEYLSPAEKTALVETCNNTAQPYPAEKTVVALFEEQVAAFPLQTALVFEEDSYSYAALNEEANRLAHHLRESLHVTPGQVIPLYMERTAYIPVAILAILKAGGVYLPLDITAPAERLRKILEDCNATVVLTAGIAGIPGLPDMPVTDVTTHPGSNTGNPVQTATPNDPAYIIYTSGTTGVPKGVIITQQNVVSLVKNISYMQLTPQLRMLCTGAPSFDATTLEFWGTLLNGGQLVMCRQETLLNTDLLQQQIQHHRINAMWFTAGWFHGLVDNNIDLFDGLDIVLTGGDRVSSTHVRKLRARYPDLEIINAYGPTENTTFSLTYQVGKEVPDNLPIGTPLENRTAYVLDGAGMPCGTGIQGEIYVGGAGLSAGYLNSDELTGEKFVSLDPGLGYAVRLYRTGDMGYRLPDGNIAFIGRKDNQVKLRGYRLETGEIVAAVLQLNGVRACEVIVATDAAGEKYLAAYIVTAFNIAEATLQDHLRTLLPAYMIPSVFIPLNALPLTVHGKVDRKRLPEPDQVAANGSNTYVPPQGIIETAMANIWQEVLGRPRISVHDDFFRIGGHSLKATRMLTRIAREIGAQISLRDIFSYPTIASLSAVIKGSSQQLPEDIPVVPVQDTYALSHAQKRLWVLNQMETNNNAYNIPYGYRFREPLHEATFRKAFEALLIRHEILRTAFVMVAGEPRQRIASPGDYILPVAFTDLTGVPQAAEQAASIGAAISGDCFDLTVAPLIRAALIKMDETDYLLFLTLHHIISDAWSMDILLKELMILYNAFSEDVIPALAPLQIQYKDYAQWQNNLLAANGVHEHRAYWTGRFSGDLPVMNLPANRPRPAVKSYRGDSLGFMLDNDTAQALRQIGQASQGSLFMTLLSAVYTFLYKYTGQEDMIIGSPVAGREHAALEGQIGFYVNTLALRQRIYADKSFTDLLQEVRENVLAAYEHQVYPFDRLVEELDLPRDLSRTPLFDVMVVLQHATGTADNPDMAGYNTALKVSKFDIGFSFREQGNGIYVELDYNTDIFDRERMVAMQDHFSRLVAQIAANPEKPLQQMEYLSEGEIKQLLDTFNDNATAYTPDTLHAMVAAQVVRTPHAIAVQFEDKHLTYAALDAAANQVAHGLRQQYQVKPGQLVGIMMERSEQIVIGVLGILKAGAAYVPVDPAYPVARIRHILEDSGVQLVITGQSTAMLPVAGIQTMLLDGELNKYPVTAPSPVNTPDDLAYIIYTSGSTGLPKGIRLLHRNAAALLHWAAMEYAASDYEVTLSATSYCFDLSVYEIFFTLVSGKRLRILGSGLDIPEWLAKEKKILLNTVPSVVEHLLREETDLSNVTVLNMAGEALPYNVMTALDKRRIEVRNLYGPSETTTYSTCYLCTPEDDQVTIGKPITNTQLYILDARQQPVATGITGEIYIGGDGLTAGYLGRDALTAEKYIPHPFMPDRYVYRTGDMGKWREDGNILFVGRIDGLVKVRGYRIELGEIETRLLQHPAVATCAVDVKEQQLLAYIVWRQQDSMEDVKSYLQEQLPSYMLPSGYITMAALPLTPNGKTDRKRLPLPDDGDKASGYVAPYSWMEKKLASIWQEVLGKKKPGIRDNFFESGGHSLKATRILSRVYKEMGVQIALRDIFTNATIESLSKVIEGASRATVRQITRVAEQPDYPLSHMQRRLWIIDQMEGPHNAYNIPYGYRFRGAFDLKALERAFERLVERHEILRTTFVLVDGSPRQQIHDAQRWRFKPEFVDLSGFGDKEQQAAALNQQEAAHFFNLATGPLLKVKLLRMSGEDHILLLTMHHIISDAWSIGVLVNEIVTLYETFRLGGTDPLPALRIQYKDFAVWQQQELSGDREQLHRKYWMEQFSGNIPVLDMPADRIRPAVKSYHGNSVAFLLDRQMTIGLLELGQSVGASLFMTLLSSIQVLLYRYTGQEDMVIGTPIAGRERHELEDQIGFYVNTLALRQRFSGADHFMDILLRVRENTLSAYEHQVYSFDQLVEELEIPRDLSRSPLFDVLMVLQNAEGASSAAEVAGGMPELLVGSYNPEVRVSKYDLSFAFNQQGNDIYVELEYNTDLFNQDRMERMRDHYWALLSAIIQNSRLPIQELSYLEETAEAVISENKETAGKSLVAIFEEQAAVSPQAIAVAYDDITLTYEMLNAAANRLAYFFRHEKGVLPGDRVGLIMHRSEQLVVAILAILKTGAAYVPVDPDYPEERVQHTFTDAEVIAVVTDDVQLADRLMPDSYQVVCLPVIAAQLAAGNSLNPGIPVSATSPAYIIYTSGSTGKPKGVMVAHNNVVNLLFAPGSSFRFGPSDVWSLFHSICFDFSVWELFGALLYGGQLVVVNKNTIQSANAFADLLIDKRITVLNQVPTMFGQVMEEILRRPVIHLRLRYIIFGGESLLPAMLKAWYNRYPQVRLINMYGITETTVHVTYKEIDEEAISSGLPNIGKPLPNVQLYVMDAQHRIVPAGVEGELVVGGAGVSMGYLNLPALTASRFINDPFHPGGKLYCSGDLGVMLPNGEVLYKGRRDGQLKIRGYRVETGEIEQRLLQHADITQAIVTGRNDADGHAQLVAYIISTAPLTIQQLRRFLGALLPGYMVPDHFVQLAQFPVTGNGKVDRAQLPAPEGIGLDSGSSYVAPQTLLEQQLVTMWQEILGRDNIGIRDDFFELGGHSLKAIKLTTRIWKEIGITIGLRDLFHFPTIETLVAAMHKRNLKNGLLIALRTGADLPNLFFIPPVMGSSTVFSSLADRLSDTVNSYGLQYRGFDYEETFDQSIEIMAANFVKEIISVQEQGTCHLFGYSMGAVVTFEVARQLENKQRKVKIILLDRGITDKQLPQENADLFPQLVGKWAADIPQESIDKYRALVLHYYALLQRYKITGTIQADITVLEAADNIVATDMHAWGSHTAGQLRHQYLSGAHHDMLDSQTMGGIISVVHSVFLNEKYLSLSQE
jgi:tyrocidine synthetase III